MAAFSIKSFDDILSDMIAWIASHSPQITDMTPGSIIRSFCESTALNIEEVYVAAYIGFRQYLDSLKTDIFGLSKKTGTTANVVVVFSRVSAGASISIPVGVKIKTATGLVFITTATGSIANGDTSSGNIPAVSAVAGAVYNVAAHTITIFDTDVDGVNSVDNANPASGGVDNETDEQFQLRFQLYIEGLGKANKAGLRYAALSVQGITSASVRDLFPAIANVNAYLYVDDGSVLGTSDALVAEVQALIDGDGTADSPGFRAGGVNVLVTKPTIVTQNIAATIYLANASVDQANTTLVLQSVITAYINNLGIGEDIIHAKLATICMGVAGVVDVVITTPVGNTAIDNTQVARVGTFTFTYSVIV